MSKPSSVFKGNVIYGLIVLIPMAIIFLLIAKIVEILEIVAKAFGLETAFSAILAVLLAVLLFLVICFIVGALVRTRVGTWSFERIEKRVLSQIPGYRIIGNMLKGFADQKTAFPLACVDLLDRIIQLQLSDNRSHWPVN